MSWFSYLLGGMSRVLPRDRMGGPRKGASSLGGNLKNLLPFFRRHWKKAGFGTLLILLSSLLGAPQPLILRYIVDEVILNREVSLLAGAMVLLVGLLVVEKLASMLQRFSFSCYEQEVLLDIQGTLLDRTLRFPKSFFDEHQTGYLMARLTGDVQGLQWFFSSTIVNILANTARLLLGIGFLFLLEWRLAAIVLLSIPGIILSVRYFSRKIHALSRHRMERQAMVSGRLQESLATVSLIKTFSSEARTVGKFVSDLKDARRVALEQSAVNSTASLIISSLPAMARLFVLALGAYWVIRGQWSLGSLIAFVTYLGFVFGPAQFLASANLQLQNARASLERVSALFDIVPEENLVRGRPVKRLEGELEFRNVSFSYNGLERVLKDISFHIRRGERFAIVGPSGVGKTTLISLILRFYRPTAGEIYFDGRAASSLEVSSLRRRMGYVSQRPVLVSGTIQENIAYGNPGAERERIQRAARAAGIHDFIMSLPGGYGAVIGEGGVIPSEGQMQRLSIARALVMDPDILVLDEPTSALDRKLEQSIFDSLPGLLRNKTLCLVSHRLSSLKEADRILILKDGTVVAQGDHPTLLETSQYYRSLALEESCVEMEMCHD